MNLATQKMIKKNEERRAIELELEVVQSYADIHGSFAESIMHFELRKSINLGYDIAEKSGLRSIIEETFEESCREHNND